MNQRILPHNIDAEKAALGALFLSKYALQKGMESLNKDLFYLDAHSKIFEAIRSLTEEKAPIDITTVTNELDKRKWLKQIGGVEYLVEVLDMVPTAANIEQYIKIIEDKAIRRRLVEEGTLIVDDGYNSEEELADLLEKAERKILSVVKTRKGTEFRTIQDVVFKAQSDLEKLSQNRGEITGIATGFANLDKVTAGLHEHELIIIAARPGMGKTAFGLNLATNIAINSGKTVALFNMEMGAEQLIHRMFSSIGQIDSYKVRTGNLHPDDWRRVNEAISRLADTKMYIDDTPGMTVSEIKAKCRRLSSSDSGLDIVIIDYLQLISGSAKYAGNRQQEVSEISRSLKTLAMELDIPVVAMAQLSRSVEGREDKRPLLSDLRESGSIEQDADIVAFLYRDDYYTKEASADEKTSITEFIIAKHRAGPTTTINLKFKLNTSTFQDIIE